MKTGQLSECLRVSSSGGITAQEGGCCLLTGRLLRAVGSHSQGGWRGKEKPDLWPVWPRPACPGPPVHQHHVHSPFPQDPGFSGLCLQPFLTFCSLWARSFMQIQNSQFSSQAVWGPLFLACLKVSATPGLCVNLIVN